MESSVKKTWNYVGTRTVYKSLNWKVRLFLAYEILFNKAVNLIFPSRVDAIKIINAAKDSIEKMDRDERYER